MSGDGSVIADTLKTGRVVCRVGGGVENEKDTGAPTETNVVRERRWSWEREEVVGCGLWLCPGPL